MSDRKSIEKIEYRHIPLERRDEENQMTIHGRAVAFNSAEEMFEWNGVKYYEKILDTAFDEADLTDVILNADHEGKPAARTRNETLKLNKRSDGLYIEADLSKNSTGRDLYEDIRGGFYDKMSFAFTTRESSYDKDTRTRTIIKVKKVYDVSCVSFPAYENTSVSARSYLDMIEEFEKSQGEPREEKNAGKEKLKLKIKLLKEIIK